LFVTRFQVLHLAGTAGRNPGGETLEFRGVRRRSNPAKIESSLARGALND
jgi:hypothetical protein